MLPLACTTTLCAFGNWAVASTTLHSGQHHAPTRPHCALPLRILPQHGAHLVHRLGRLHTGKVAPRSISSAQGSPSTLQPGFHSRCQRVEEVQTASVQRQCWRKCQCQPQCQHRWRQHQSLPLLGEQWHSWSINSATQSQHACHFHCSSISSRRNPKTQHPRLSRRPTGPQIQTSFSPPFFKCVFPTPALIFRIRFLSLANHVGRLFRLFHRSSHTQASFSYRGIQRGLLG